MKKREINRAGMIGRWRPVHLGHKAVLRALCDQFDEVKIGVGSSNVYNYRNAFSVTEVIDMLQLSLDGYANFSLVPIPDTESDLEWCEAIVGLYQDTDAFITANPFVKSLLEDQFSIHHPATFLTPAQKAAISGSMVRKEMAQGGNWQQLLPPEIVDYISHNQLDKRFREMFGLQTLALETIIV